VPNIISDDTATLTRKSISTTQTQAALATPDKDVPMPSKNQKTGSFAAAVLDLEPGQSASRVHRVNPDMTVGEFTEQLKDIKEMMRNNVTYAVTAAKRRTMGTYCIEVGEVVMPGGTLYVVVVVSRTS
jgi:hypothetical protein